MKKILLMLVLACSTYAGASAQILRAEELEKYAMKKYGDKWVDAATNLASQITLDKNNAISYVEVIPAEGKTKDQLYVLLNYWFTATFNDANAVIKLNDKDLGTIIAQGYVDGIAHHSGGTNSYIVSIKPLIKCDIKDNKVRVTYTVPYYCAVCVEGGGILSVFDSHDTKYKHTEENWMLDKCFPFKSKDSHKRTSSKALVMAHAYSNVVMDKIAECVKNGLVGNENDDW